MYGGCECLSDLPDSGLESDGDADFRRSRNNRIKKFAYYSSGERAGLLRESYLDTRTAIYECHEQCSCGPDCPNRVVERGRTLPLQIFRTDDGRGWGKLDLESPAYLVCVCKHKLTTTTKQVSGPQSISNAASSWIPILAR